MLFGGWGGTTVTPNRGAVRTQQWRAVRDSDWELYDMVRDPTETRNLASQFPGKVTEMENLFLSWKNQTK